jgi:hypothetical protein
VIQGHWLVKHMFYAHSVYGPLKLGRVRFTVDATNEDFAFPATPSDPKLAEAPAQPKP